MVSILLLAGGLFLSQARTNRRLEGARNLLGGLVLGSGRRGFHGQTKTCGGLQSARRLSALGRRRERNCRAGFGFCLLHAADSGFVTAGLCTDCWSRQCHRREYPRSRERNEGPTNGFKHELNLMPIWHPGHGQVCSFEGTMVAYR